MTNVYDIVVVGAGMVGAALATGLGQSGFSVALVDRNNAPGFQPDTAPGIRVSALSAGSERYLTQLGAWAHMKAMRTTPYTRLAVWDGTPHPLLDKLLPKTAAKTVFDARDLATTHLGHIVENNVTQQALWQTASAQPTVTIYAGNGVAALSNTAADAMITLEDQSVLRCQLVIGADGAQSPIRTLSGISVSRDQYHQQAMVACVRYRGPVADITWQAFFSSGPRAFLPLYSAGEKHGDETWASLVWYDAPDVLARLKALPEQAFLAEVQQAFPDDLPPLTHVESRASFPIARQHAHQYSYNRVVLAGDAAHTINPLAGQGVNLGFQDAACLQGLLDEARRNATDFAAPSLLGRYERQRRPVNRRMMLAMDAFYHLFSNQHAPLQLARNVGLGLAQTLPFAKNQVARYAMGIGR